MSKGLTETQVRDLLDEVVARDRARLDAYVCGDLAIQADTISCSELKTVLGAVIQRDKARAEAARKKAAEAEASLKKKLRSQFEPRITAAVEQFRKFRTVEPLVEVITEAKAASDSVGLWGHQNEKIRVATAIMAAWGLTIKPQEFACKTVQYWNKGRSRNALHPVGKQLEMAFEAGTIDAWELALELVEDQMSLYDVSRNGELVGFKKSAVLATLPTEKEHLKRWCELVYGADGSVRKSFRGAVAAPELGGL